MKTLPYNSNNSRLVNASDNKEGMFSKSTIKWGVAIAGCAVSAYLIYNNSNFILNVTKDLFNRVSESFLSKAVSVKDYLLMKCLELLVIIPRADTILKSLFGRPRVWQAANAVKKDTVEVKLLKLAFVGLIVYVVLRVIYAVVKKCVQMFLMMGKMYKSHSPAEMYQFLSQVPNKSEFLKLSAETLDTIIVNRKCDPWANFQMFSGMANLYPKLYDWQGKLQYEELKKMLVLAGYPADVCDRLSRKNDLWQPKNDNPDHFKNGADIWEVLSYLSRYPAMDKGNSSLLNILSDTILDLKNPLNAFRIVYNEDLRTENETVVMEFFDLVRSQYFETICDQLSEWLHFFKGDFVLSKTDIFKIFGLKKAFDESFPNFLREHLIDKCKTELIDCKSNKEVKEELILDIEKFLDDSDFKKCNVLETNLDIQDIGLDHWLFVVMKFTRIIEIIDIDEKDIVTKNVINFCALCLSTSDAKSTIGRQNIINRIIGIANHLGEWAVNSEKDNLDINIKKQLTKKITSIIKILSHGGTGCADLAFTSLISAENRIMLFNDIKHIPFILVNMFKHNLISTKLVSGQEVDPLETYFSYLLAFNSVIGLGISKTSTMLYESYAQRQPLGGALAQLVKEFNAENLINYTAKLEEFKLIFKIEAKNKFKKIKQLMNDVYAIAEMSLEKRREILSDIDSEGVQLKGKQIDEITNNPQKVTPGKLMRKLDESRKQMEVNFYKEKAEKLFLDSPFIIEQKEGLKL